MARRYRSALSGLLELLPTPLSIREYSFRLIACSAGFRATEKKLTEVKVSGLVIGKNGQLGSELRLLYPVDLKGTSTWPDSKTSVCMRYFDNNPLKKRRDELNDEFCRLYGCSRSSSYDAYRALDPGVSALWVQRRVFDDVLRQRRPIPSVSCIDREAKLMFLEDVFPISHEAP